MDNPNSFDQQKNREAPPPPVVLKIPYSDEKVEKLTDEINKLQVDLGQVRQEIDRRFEIIDKKEERIIDLLTRVMFDLKEFVEEQSWMNTKIATFGVVAVMFIVFMIYYYSTSVKARPQH